MGLLTALHTASSSLGVLSAKAEITSRNVANANTPYATQKSAGVVSTPYGVTLSPTTRDGGRDVVRKRVKPGRLRRLNSRRSSRAWTPSTPPSATPLTSNRRRRSPVNCNPHCKPIRHRRPTLAPPKPPSPPPPIWPTSLNSASQTITSLRTDTENQISASVETINSLISQFDSVNKQIVNGTIRGVDVTDTLDQRDQILANLSEQIGVKVMKGTNNGTSLYTDGGALLYDMNRYDPATPMVKCSFPQDPKFSSQASIGNPDKNITSITIDGHEASCGSSKSDTISSGRIAGLVQIHDETTTIYRSQLDEMARSLIVAFSEKDLTTTSGLSHTGLFTATNLLTAADSNNSARTRHYRPRHSCKSSKFSKSNKPNG